MLPLSTKYYSVTVDTTQQKIDFVSKKSFFSRASQTDILFTDVKQVYLDCSEEGYTSSTGDYTSEQRVRRRWAILLTLRDGRTVTVAEEITDHRAGEIAVLKQQHARWQSLANTVSEMIEQPLSSMPSVTNEPHTFIEAINSILQRYLKQSGLNSTVDIRNGKDLGIEIVVNGKSYTAVDEVEDPAVRNLIKSSIQDWDNSGNR